MTICRVAGRDVSNAAFRYSILYHNNSELPEWWKRKFFYDERKELGVDSP